MPTCAATSPAAGSIELFLHSRLWENPVRGPRAEVAVTLRDDVPTPGLARTVAVLAATPAVDGIVLVADALIDLGAPLWERPGGLPPFSAV